MNNLPMKKIDVIVPVKNEVDNVRPLVERIDVSLRKVNQQYRIIFVDDHSTDGTIATLDELAKSYPVVRKQKKGLPGKAFSILEAANISTSDFVVIIDGDLQYPPEAIPFLLEKTKQFDVVVAKRDSRHEPVFRQFTSKAFKYIFGQLLFGFSCDVQSGLKVFRRDILTHILTTDVTAWTLDLPLLHTANQLGYTVGEVPIEFGKRENGESKISVLRSTLEIGLHSLKFKFKHKSPPSIPTHHPKTMVGAGVFHKKSQYITHTTLPSHQSAVFTVTPMQKIVIMAVLTIVVLGFVVNPLFTLKAVVAVLSLLYFLDIFFNLFLIVRSLHVPPEIGFTQDELSALNDDDLPIYTILCPLYKEGKVLPHFINSIEKIDWPKEKLDVLLLLEEDDTDTISVAKQIELPEYFRVLIVPDTLPKTKPKACNYGLSFAKGEYLVIYDAEDQPDVQQLKKAHAAFLKSPAKIKCMQAKLNYFNPDQNLLTRLFTAEYSLWFDVVLTGLQSINTTIPLGGTSNHFRTKDLRALCGWDSFNVTEDCDLGIRLFKKGALTAVIDSVTLEEANSSVQNWLRQRSRWIKGYMQTFLIHMREPGTFFKEQGIHAVIFQLVVGGKIAFMLINPIMWLLTISYFTLYFFVGDFIEELFPSIVFYMAITSLVVGNFMCMYYYMIGIAKRGQWNLVKFVYLKPLYWIMVSISAVIALYQLIVKPHYWEKTNHGLHLKPNTDKKSLSALTKDHSAKFIYPGVIPPEIEHEAEVAEEPVVEKQRSIPASVVGSGAVFMAAAVFSYFLNFVYNVYLGRELENSAFATITLIGSFLYLGQVLFTSLSRTVTYKNAYLLGKYQIVISNFWKRVQGVSFKVGIAFTAVWIASSWIISNFFNIDSIVPIATFAPVWFLGFVSAVDMGFLAGQMQFGSLAIVLIFEAVLKLVLSVLFVEMNQEYWVYLSLPISMVSVAILARFFANRSLKYSETRTSQSVQKFPRKFFFATVANRIAVVAFLSVDIILAKHFFTPEDAGYYSLISLVGKMVFFAGTMVTSFITPIVAKSEGQKNTSKYAFLQLLIVSILSAGVPAIALTATSSFFLPRLFSQQSVVILPFIGSYLFGIASFAVASNVITYYQAKKSYIFSIAGLLMAVVQITTLILYHADLAQMVLVMQSVGISNLVVVLSLHILIPLTRKIKGYSLDFAWLFSSYKPNPPKPHKLKFLIFNWRDTQHAWSGGAEVYIHEIAKQWVKDGHKVTVFCGNDGHHARNEVVDGVQVVRRGGFFTVYIWAFIYYVLRFRKLFDVVIDCENGVPFFTPMFVREPKFLLIFHVHQKIFREQLSFPAAQIASFLESKVMPKVYKKQPVITISQSSNHDIVNLGLSDIKNIAVIEPGLDQSNYKMSQKTVHPSFLYLGRLKPYKNVDIAIKAFAKVIARNSDARLTIAGEGESRKSLERLVEKLHIEKNVSFAGRVTEEQKVALLGSSWAALQPSSFEGWGITVIEANACGTPVIASNVEGLRDSVVANKTGILVRELTSPAFAKEMNKLIDDHVKLGELSNAAYSWSQQFNWENSAHRFSGFVVAQLQLQLQQKAYQEVTWQK